MVAEADVFLVDVSMPGIGGLEFARIVREKYPDRKVALITANIQDTMHQKAEDLGVGFIEKPPTQAMLQKWLETIDD